MVTESCYTDKVETVLAVDPGRRKCGLAVVNPEGTCLERAVVDRESLLSQVRQWCERWGVGQVLVGGATGSKVVVAELKSGLGRPVQVVDEYRSSERARARYFQDHPPRGWWRLVPLGMQVPSVPIDDYAALILAEDFCKSQRKETA